MGINTTELRLSRRQSIREDFPRILLFFLLLLIINARDQLRKLLSFVIITLLVFKYMVSLGIQGQSNKYNLPRS